MERNCRCWPIRVDGSEKNVLSGKPFFLLLGIGKLTVQRLMMQVLMLPVLAFNTQRKT